MTCDPRTKTSARAYSSSRARTPKTVLFADAGHRGRMHHDSLQLIGVELIVPDKHKL